MSPEVRGIVSHYECGHNFMLLALIDAGIFPQAPRALLSGCLQPPGRGDEEPHLGLGLRTSRFFSPHKDFRRVRSEGGGVTLLVTIYNGKVSSFTLAPEAGQLFGDRGVAVEFELASE
jgi:hypothetical protein